MFFKRAVVKRKKSRNKKRALSGSCGSHRAVMVKELGWSCHWDGLEARPGRPPAIPSPEALEKLRASRAAWSRPPRGWREGGVGSIWEGARVSGAVLTTKQGSEVRAFCSLSSTLLSSCRAVSPPVRL